MKPGVRGLERALRGFGDLLHRKFLDLVEDEDIPLLLRESLEEFGEPIPKSLVVEAPFLGRVLGPLRNVRAEKLATMRRSLAVVGRDTQSDSVDPGAQGRAAFEGVQSTRDDEEDVVSDILEIGGAYPQMTQASPDIADVNSVDFGETVPGGRRGLPSQVVDEFVGHALRN